MRWYFPVTKIFVFIWKHGKAKKMFVCQWCSLIIHIKFPCFKSSLLHSLINCSSVVHYKASSFITFFSFPLVILLPLSHQCLLYHSFSMRPRLGPPQGLHKVLFVDCQVRRNHVDVDDALNVEDRGHHKLHGGLALSGLLCPWKTEAQFTYLTYKQFRAFHKFL